MLRTDTTLEELGFSFKDGEAGHEFGCRGGGIHQMAQSKIDEKCDSGEVTSERSGNLMLRSFALPNADLYYCGGTYTAPIASASVRIKNNRHVHKCHTH